MDEENTECMYNSALLSHKEQNYITWRKMDGDEDHVK